MEGEMWGFRSPTPRGRTESCTLRILTDALTGAHEKAQHVGIYRADLSYSRRLAHSRSACNSPSTHALALLRRSSIPMSGAAGGAVTLHLFHHPLP